MKPLRAIVTGGATNIGLAISEAFLARGGRVVVSQRQRGLPPEVAKRYGDRLIVLPVDVGQPASEAEAVVAAFAEQFSVDVSAITGDQRAQLFKVLGNSTFGAVVSMYIARGASCCSIFQLRRA